LPEAISAISANDIWAVGFTSDMSGQEGLILHWDGNAWTATTYPPATRLAGVAAIASNDVWAVGSKPLQGGGSRAIFIHWDGIAWTEYGSGLPGESGLSSISASSATNIWATGTYRLSTGESFTVILGRNEEGGWDRYTFPGGVGGYNFSSISAVAPNNVWAIGISAAHWNGSGWVTFWVSQPYTTFSGIDALSGQDVWAVGFYSANAVDYTAITERYFDPCTLPTATPTSAATPTVTRTPTLEPPRCPGERFKDVCPGDYFYAPVLALNDASILLGYNSAPPCNNYLWIPCFKPFNGSTRGQISKVVSLAANFNEPISGQTFQDVPPGSTFYTYTQRMASRAIINGYPCGGAGEPCVPPGNRPYFRTNNNVTRGQLSKMISLAFNWNEPVTGQQFQDVVAGSTFYDYIGRLVVRSIINGYPCGGAGEPCEPPGNLPYFRPNNNVTRGQTGKIVQLARTQPTPTPTITIAPTATEIGTPTPMPSESTPTPAPLTPTGTPIPMDTITPTPVSTATIVTRF
jgi:hypothetical protein